MTRCPHTHTAAEGNNHRNPQEPRYEPYYDEQASCTYTGSRSHSFVPPQAHAGKCLVMSIALGNVEHCANIPTMLTLTTIHSSDFITRRRLSQEPHHAGVQSSLCPLPDQSTLAYGDLALPGLRGSPPICDAFSS